MNRDIEATFVKQTGIWNEKETKFDITKEQTRHQTIQMQINESDNGPILRFIGGPTGYEAFYIADLEASPREDNRFYICAGTPNGYEICHVSRKEVYKFLEDYKATREGA